MENGMTRAERNLILLQSLIPKNEKIYVWCCRPEGDFIAASCPEEDRPVLEEAFRRFEGLERLAQYAAQADKRPVLLGSPIGMQWALSYEPDRNGALYFALGPVFYDAPRPDRLRRALQPYVDSRAGADWAAALTATLPRLPVMTYAIFSRYVLMIHNTLTDQQLGLDALEGDLPQNGLSAALPVGVRDRSKIYAAEQAMLEMVRTGNINYHAVLQRSVQLSPGVPVQGQEPLRQMKTSIIVFTTLVCRAAMEGGLSPEVAYPLGDSYIQSAENSRDSGELNALASAMYHDFIYRVHHVRTNPTCSHAVQKVCDYIDMSLDRPIRTADLAVLVGYTEYYLTEKFKKETGQSVSQYIRAAKITRAKVLLTSTALSVRDIAERLAFNTPNYFIQSFRALEGLTPAQYRKRHRQG